jgi:cyclopropane fatty-acyl-phospholipid synthase-like methyltransferase
MKLVITDANGLPSHLGGHQNETHIDEGALMHLVNKFGVKSYLDVGCGPGGMVELAHEKGLVSLGVDGDFTLERPDASRYVLHDYTKGPASVGKPIGHDYWDLGWSCEFLEHVSEQYMDNYMDTFLKCKRIVVTHAFPGQGGHHHVNEQDPNYWFNQFGRRGFLLDLVTTDEVRKASTMGQRYIRVSGMVFFNSNLNWQV